MALLLSYYRAVAWHNMYYFYLFKMTKTNNLYVQYTKAQAFMYNVEEQKF